MTGELAGLVIRRKLRTRALLILVVCLLAAALIGCLTGPVRIPVRVVIGVLIDQVPGVELSASWPDSFETILLKVRFPRVVQGGLVGLGLGVAGASLQGLFRNPMADPYVLGLSSGAALGAAVAIVTGINLLVLGLGTTPLFAFVGAVSSMVCVYQIARRRDRVPVITLLLAGVAVGTILAAVVTLLMVLSHEKLDRIVFWLMGGLANSQWSTIGATAPYLAAGTVVLIVRSRDLNLLTTGEESAQSLGLDVERSKKLILAMASLVTAAAVCASGTIAFVGLIVPHIARLILGSDYRVVVPGSALIGACLLIMADVVARVALAPSELPVGVVTSLLGGPFFLWLLVRRRYGAFGGE